MRTAPRAPRPRRRASTRPRRSGRRRPAARAGRRTGTAVSGMPSPVKSTGAPGVAGAIAARGLAAARPPAIAVRPAQRRRVRRSPMVASSSLLKGFASGQRLPSSVLLSSSGFTPRARSRSTRRPNFASCFASFDTARDTSSRIAPPGSVHSSILSPPCLYRTMCAAQDLGVAPSNAGGAFASSVQLYAYIRTGIALAAKVTSTSSLFSKRAPSGQPHRPSSGCSVRYLRRTSASPSSAVRSRRIGVAPAGAPTGRGKSK